MRLEPCEETKLTSEYLNKFGRGRQPRALKPQSKSLTNLANFLAKSKREHLKSHSDLRHVSKETDESQALLD